MATTLAPKTKLAYLVKCDEACEIIYATSSAAARRMGAQEIGVDFEDVESCTRAPYLDAYAEAAGGPSPKMLIEEHNWRFECGHCFANVDQHEELRVYDEYEAPYCCMTCLAAEQKKQADHTAAKEALTLVATTRWPGADICWMNQDKGTVFLRIAGATAGALWHQDTDEVQCGAVDAPVWEAYRLSLPSSAAPIDKNTVL